jgi:hypothetical protein
MIGGSKFAGRSALKVPWKPESCWSGIPHLLGTYSTVMSILDATLSPASDSSSSSNALLSALNLTIGRIDYTNNLTTMWLNPNLATFDYLNPPSPDAEYAGLAPAFNSMSIYSRSGSFDEITVLAIPEPSSIAFVGLAASLTPLNRRR